MSRSGHFKANRISGEMLRDLLFRAVLPLHFVVNGLYWAMTRTMIRIWGRHGLHAISVGDFTVGGQKKRSLLREEMLVKSLPLLIDFRGKSCLDLACNDGFWSFRFGRFGIRRLLGIDLSKSRIIRANFLKTVYHFPTFEFKQRDILKFLDQNAQRYDIVLLLSILYHLPETLDWPRFFKSIAGMNNECLIIDTRWYDNDAYYYDRTSGDAMIFSSDGSIRKWRPTRTQLFSYLYGSGYEKVTEIDLSDFLTDREEAFGNGDPYTTENVADYITGNRSLVIAYKNRETAVDVIGRLKIKDAAALQAAC